MTKKPSWGFWLTMLGIALFCVVDSVSWGNRVVHRSGSSLTCTDLVALLGFGSNEGSATTLGQKIRNDSGMTVCEATMVLSGSGNAEAVLNSQPDGSGTDYGSASNSQALAGSLAAITFTWSSNPTVGAGTHFYIVFRGTGGGSISGYQFGGPSPSVAGDEYETGNGYNAYKNGATSGTVDLRFGLKTMQ